MNRLILAGAAALTLAGPTSASAQAVYVERITPAPVYVAPADMDGYVIEQRVVPSGTYERQVVTPSAVIPPNPRQRVVVERRVVTTAPLVATRPLVTEQRIVTQQPRFVTSDEPATIATGPQAITTETTAVSTCRYDLDGRMICD